MTQATLRLRRSVFVSLTSEATKTVRPEASVKEGDLPARGVACCARLIQCTPVALARCRLTAAVWAFRASRAAAVRRFLKK
jgi:hypothetical protein